LYSNLRFMASVSLVALASLVGVLALFPDTLEELVVASAETSDSPATACKQDWLRFDPSCLSRRGMPWGRAIRGLERHPIHWRGRVCAAFDGKLTRRRGAAGAGAAK